MTAYRSVSDRAHAVWRDHAIIIADTFTDAELRQCYDAIIAEFRQYLGIADWDLDTEATRINGIRKRAERYEQMAQICKWWRAQARGLVQVGNGNIDKLPFIRKAVAAAVASYYFEVITRRVGGGTCEYHVRAMVDRVEAQRGGRYAAFTFVNTDGAEVTLQPEEVESLCVGIVSPACLAAQPP